MPYVRKVRYWDVDANAHVFNVNYLIYVDDALTDLFDDIGLGFASHADDGVVVLVAHAECDFVGEAVIGEVLETTVVVSRVGNTSITFSFQVAKQGSGEVVATGTEVYVVVDIETRRPSPIPNTWRDKLQTVLA